MLPVLVASSCLWKCRSLPSWRNFGYAFWWLHCRLSGHVIMDHLVISWLPSLLVSISSSVRGAGCLMQTLVPCFVANWWKNCYCWMGPLYSVSLLSVLYLHCLDLVGTIVIRELNRFFVPLAHLLCLGEIRFTSFLFWNSFDPKQSFNLALYISTNNIL